MMLKKKKIRKILKIMMNIKKMKIIPKKEEKVTIKTKKLIQVMNICQIQEYGSNGFPPSAAGRYDSSLSQGI